MCLSTREDAEGLSRKVTLLVGELVEVHQAREVAEEMFHVLSDVSAHGVWQLVVSEMEHREQFEELSLLRALGAELCVAIVGPSWVRSHLSVRMWTAALRNAELAGELTMLWSIVSYDTERVLGRSPNETFWVEVMDELVAKFRRLEELCSRLEGPSAMIYDLLHGPPPGQARCSDGLGEAALAAPNQDLLLGNADKLSSLVAYLFMIAKLLEGRIDTADANGIRYGTRSALVAILSHFLSIMQT
jgi:hypothetical protein